MNKTMSYIISLATIIGFAFACYFYVDAKYARAAELQAVEQRLNYKIESDKLNAMQTRLWSLEDRYGSDPDKVQVPEIKQHMKELKAVVDTQGAKVKTLEGTLK